jgi:UTP-glucose-1-phosphate uridylyltransferase
MRLQFKMEGGIAYFPGRSSPITIDSDQLPKQESDELKRLVNATRFFALPTVMGAPSPGAADYRQYTITIEDEGKQHTVHVTDLIEDPNLQALLAYLRARRSAG